MTGEKQTMVEKYSDYGTYTIKDSVDVILPSTEIKFKRTDKDRFSYHRKDSENNQIQKSISTSNDLKIKLCPILPLNLPSKKTNDLIFLRLSEQIFVGSKSSLDIFVRFPIEIGIFVISDKTSDLLDVLTCEPLHSRFALYGAPEGGKLCMYSKVSEIAQDKSPEPFVWAKMKISIKNELEHGVKIGKFVFPLSSHQVYYRNNSSDAHIDDLSGTIYNDTVGELLEIKQVELSKKEDWEVSSPREKESLKFVMEKGFD